MDDEEEVVNGHERFSDEFSTWGVHELTWCDFLIKKWLQIFTLYSFMWLLRTIFLEAMWFPVNSFVFMNERSIKKELFITLSRARHFRALSRDSMSSCHSARLFGVQNCESTSPEKVPKLLIFKQLHPTYSLLSLSLDGLYVFCFSLTIARPVKVRWSFYAIFNGLNT